MKRIMRRGKAPKRLCYYVASVARGTHSKSSSSVRVVDQRGWRDVVVEYDSVMQGGVQGFVPRPEGKSGLTSRWIIADHVLVTGTVEQRLHHIRVDAAVQLELVRPGLDGGGGRHFPQ